MVFPFHYSSKCAKSKILLFLGGEGIGKENLSGSRVLTLNHCHIQLRLQPAQSYMWWEGGHVRKEKNGWKRARSRGGGGGRKMKTFRLQDGLNRRETQNMQEVVKPPLQSDFWKKTVWGNLKVFVIKTAPGLWQHAQNYDLLFHFHCKCIVHIFSQTHPQTLTACFCFFVFCNWDDHVICPDHVQCRLAPGLLFSLCVCLFTNTSSSCTHVLTLADMVKNASPTGESDWSTRW